MSKVIKSRHSSHLWCNETQWRSEGLGDYGVIYLMTLAQEQRR